MLTPVIGAASENFTPPPARVRTFGKRTVGRPVVYGALVAFSWLYYYRPEDFIPGLSYIPMAKITGLFAFLTLGFGLMSGARTKIPLAVKLLWLLLFQMVMCIPFAIWRGGAFSTVADKYSKTVVVAMLISMAVYTVAELRKLMWIQASAVALVVFVSILLRNFHNGRLHGVQKSILENPNDLAINLAISFPLGMAFMLSACGFKKIVWGVSLIFMAMGIVMTSSRSGLLAFILSFMICLWEYGVKGKRRHLIWVSVLSLGLGLAMALSSSHYRARVESIALGNIAGSGDKGSLEARKTLLKKSIMTALTHPLFGVGPGCFPVLDKTWYVVHNSYTELAAESGIPALVLFLMAIWAAFKNIAYVRKSTRYEDDPDFRLFIQALWAGLAAYVMGACFASTEYSLYPYFMVGYSCAMVRIVEETEGVIAPSRNDASLARAKYDRFRRPQPAWSR